VVESDVVLSTGVRGSNVGVDVGVVGFDLDLPTRKRSKNVGVVARAGFFGDLRVAKSDGEGFE
jgi:hypothetical protein